tara:strand:- start:36 stop:476 length:441 start_codon:yes stop_codon:yes gene_type:complete
MVEDLQATHPEHHGLAELLVIVKRAITGEDDGTGSCNSIQIDIIRRAIVTMTETLSSYNVKGRFILDEAIAEVTEIPTILQATTKYLNLQPNKIFFQIGTNDGDDDFRLLITGEDDGIQIEIIRGYRDSDNSTSGYKILKIKYFFN